MADSMGPSEAQQNFNAAMEELKSQLEGITEVLNDAHKMLEVYTQLGPLDQVMTTLTFAEKAFQILTKRGQGELLREICIATQDHGKTIEGEEYLKQQLGDDFWNRVNFQTD